ncbi:hypothetical protein N7471_000455 [Penicillium samsonianum]|uniref:uncharacterized protein n=1 Tax=Penicillium samsonianum TaxID=1882272 RepID=UPI002547D225|nr:uncharacterized protein N7471_000455 [Penicillium samsonianum]KAJ6149256.1 hypothetical protein N7471_000455 [Penicillium samsonianum]
MQDWHDLRNVTGFDRSAGIGRGVGLQTLAEQFRGPVIGPGPRVTVQLSNIIVSLLVPQGHG